MNCAPKTFGNYKAPAATITRMASTTGLLQLRGSINSRAMSVLDTCKTTIHNSIAKMFGCSAIGIKLRVQADSRLRKCGCGLIGIRQNLSAEYKS